MEASKLHFIDVWGIGVSGLLLYEDVGNWDVLVPTPIYQVKFMATFLQRVSCLRPFLLTVFPIDESCNITNCNR